MIAWFLQHLVLSLFSAAGVILTGAILSRWFRDPLSRYRLLTLLLPVLLFLLPLQALVAQLNIPTPMARATPAELIEIMFDAPHEAPCSAPLAAAPPATPAGRMGEHVSADGPLTFADVGPIALGAYLTGLATLLGILGLRLVRTTRLLRSSRPVRDDRVLALWSRLWSDRAVRTKSAPPRLVESERVNAPGCWGLIYPTVVLPAGGTLGPDRLELALRHELAHLRRHDALVVVARELLCALYWFNPLVWFYARAQARYQELSCDALVLRDTGKHLSYAATLLDFCRVPPTSARALVPTMVTGSGSRRELQRRLAMIHRLQSSPVPALRFFRTRAAAALIAALGSAAAIACSVGPGPAPRQAAAQPEKTPPAAEPDVALRLGQDGIDVEKIEAKAVKSITIRAGGERRDSSQLFRLEQAFAGHGLSRSGTATEQETLVSAHAGKVQGNVISARDLIANLPEGSMLRAEITGERIDLEKSAQRTRLTVHSGRAKIIDEQGVVRVILTPSRPGHLGIAPRVEPAADGQGALVRLEVTTEPGTVMQLDITAEAGEVVVRASASKSEVVPGEGSRTTPADVHAALDMTTGVPAGEKGPPPGSVRYYLQGGDERTDTPVRVKMQWTHDLSKRTDGSSDQKPDNRAK